jgi:uncharacterized membrane protein (UPF0127 family)
MGYKQILFGLAFFSLFFTGCNKYPFPQPTLSQKTIFVNGVPIFVEIAEKRHEHEVGLMGRESLPEGHGMLFLLPKPMRVGFWMKNTQLELSIAYISSDATIVEIYDLIPFDETLRLSQSDQVLFALEVPQNWFKNNNISVGDKVEF